MKRSTTLLIAFAVVLATAVPSFSAEDNSKEADTKAIAKLAASYQMAFNRGDAKAVAALYAPDGDFVGARGILLKGREQIQEAYGRFFALNPSVQLTVNVVSLRFVGTDVAVINGAPEITPPLAGPPVEARTTVILVKQDDRWMVESARDTLIPIASNYDHLKKLEWMIGEWDDSTADSQGVSIESTCKWTMNKNFIIRRFTAEVKDRISVDGTQVIGWDSRHNQIRSWVFDSKGGFIEGFWRRDGKRWIVETSGVLQNGSEVSAVNTTTAVDADTFTFQSTNRFLDGKRQPDIATVEVKRRGSVGGKQGTASEEDSPRETILPK